MLLGLLIANHWDTSLRHDLKSPWKHFGLHQQRIELLLSGLIFSWERFPLVRRGHAPRAMVFLLPCLAMLTFGWTRSRWDF